MEKEGLKEQQEETKLEDDNKENENKENVKKEEAKFEQIKDNPKKVKENLKKMEKENKKAKKIWIPILITFSIIILLGLVFSTIFALINMNKNTIISGVKIQGIDVSGLSVEEARGKIETVYNEKLANEISVKYQDYETKINAQTLETKYEIEKAVQEAIGIGRNNNIFVNNYEILFALIGKKDINVNMQLNEDIARQTIEDIGTNLPGVVIDSAYYIEDNKLIITKGKEGIKIDTDSLLEKIKQDLQKPEINNGYIDIPVINQQPLPIDIDKIHSEVYKEVKNASYTQNPFTITPEVEGVDFDVNAAKNMLLEDKEQYTIDLVITKPQITTDQIGTEAFPDQLSTFKTTYDGGNVDRSTNLRLACKKINGKVILPGETFSYNKTLGPRTAAAGYKNAAIYSGGEVVDGLGGGICQISSTLYNAVLRANLEIVERRNHQFVTSYVEAGMDATVVYGSIDFKFKNTRKYPIKLIASAKNGVASVSIYGIKEEQEYTFSFKTIPVSTIPTSTKYIEDDTLPAGTEKVKQKGANGKITETYMTKMLNGKVVSTTLLSKDTYDAMQKIVIKGTKTNKDKETTTTNSKPETNTTEKDDKEEKENKTENKTEDKKSNKTSNESESKQNTTKKESKNSNSKKEN